MKNFFSKYITIIGLVLSGAALYFSLIKINFSEVYQVVQIIDNDGIILISFALLFYILSCIIRAFMWMKIITIQENHNISYGTYFNILMIGMFSNNIFPAKMGEFIRTYLMKKKTGISQSYILGTIFIERIFDLMNLFILLLAGMYYFHISGIMVKIALILSAVIAVAFIFIIVLLNKKRMNINRISVFKKISSTDRFVSLSRKVDLFAKSLHDLLKFKKVIIVFILSMTIWFLHICTLYILGLLLKIDLPFYSYFFIIAILNLSFLIPSAPGGIGIYQYAAIFSMSLYGINENVSFTFGVFSHFFSYMIILPVGIFSIIQENLSISKVLSIGKLKS